MIINDLYHLTKDQNRRYAKSNLTNLVFTNSRFEGLTTTLPQTQTIIDGMSVEGVPIDDINIIVQLKRGWQYVINSDDPLNMKFLQHINKIVARDESLDPGNFRTGNGAVATDKGEFIPEDFDFEKENTFLNDLLQSDRSITDKSLTLMYQMMRGQWFWDGNKRTATLAANKLMIDNGTGLINIPVNKWEKWNELISSFYYSGDMKELKEWTYREGIQGVFFNNSRNREKSVNKIDFSNYHPDKNNGRNR